MEAYVVPESLLVDARTKLVYSVFWYWLLWLFVDRFHLTADLFSIAQNVETHTRGRVGNIAF